MIGKRLVLGFVALCLGLPALGIMVLTGCGTLANLNAPTPDPGRSLFRQKYVILPYGGVLQDGKSGLEIVQEGGVYWFLAPYLLCVDLPVSLVGDTLTLPYVVYRLAGPDPPLVPSTDKTSKEGAAKSADEKADVGEPLTPPYIFDHPTGPDRPFVLQRTNNPK